MALDVGVTGRTGRDHALTAQRAGVVEVGAVDAVTGHRAARYELAGVVVDGASGQAHVAAGGDHARIALGDDRARDLLGAVVDGPFAVRAATDVVVEGDDLVIERKRRRHVGIVLGFPDCVLRPVLGHLFCSV